MQLRHEFLSICVLLLITAFAAPCAQAQARVGEAVVVQNQILRVTHAASSQISVGDGAARRDRAHRLADQRFNQMITNRLLGSVLLGVNEQINCHDCVSAFGSAGSFSAGIHGRKELTNNLSLLAGLAYTQYNEGGYHVTTAPIGAGSASASPRAGSPTSSSTARWVRSPSATPFMAASDCG